MIKMFLGTLLFLMVGCSTIGNPPVSNWPELKVNWHRVSSKEMADFCVAANADNPWVWLHGSPLVIIMGCAEADFDKMECDIYVPEAEFPDRWLDKHELQHCQGWDHIGGSGMRDAWMRWQQRQP